MTCNFIIIVMTLIFFNTSFSMEKQKDSHAESNITSQFSFPSEVVFHLPTQEEFQELQKQTFQVRFPNASYETVLRSFSNLELEERFWRDIKTQKITFCPKIPLLTWNSLLFHIKDTWISGAGERVLLAKDPIQLMWGATHNKIIAELESCNIPEILRQGDFLLINYNTQDELHNQGEIVESTDAMILFCHQIFFFFPSGTKMYVSRDENEKPTSHPKIEGEECWQELRHGDYLFDSKSPIGLKLLQTQTYDLKKAKLKSVL